ncbi:MAG: SMP-30/gluconolactonase/LRE family protein [Sedimentisphaerales bacterium]|nr:SMP-30/gluconolactonase/LRE family protein [Sedimentisphaerales bacterium]
MLTVESLAADGQSVIAADAKLERLAGGFGFTEGPAADAAGNVFFTDQPNNRIYRWSVDGELSVFHENPGRANGLYFDKDGNLLACADLNNELWQIDMQGRVTVLVEDYGGKKLNGPNDLWVNRKGGIYFTDPFYSRTYWDRGPIEQDGQHVYYLPPDRSGLVRVTTDLVQPNGIIGTPDDKLLYIADIGAGKTYVYRINTDGRLSNKTLFCLMGSDGMTIDNRGNIYLTGDGVTVFNPRGREIEHIAVPESWTANVTFGGKDRDVLFITAQNSLYSLRMRVKGASIIPDFNDDEKVDMVDFARLAQYWRRDESSVDISPAPIGDRRVDIQDLAVLADYWLKDVLPVTLEAYWKLDEQEGGIAKNSVSDNHGTVYGEPVWQFAGGKKDGALQYDGIDDYMSTGFVLDPAGGVFSVFAWIKSDVTGLFIISQADGAGTGETWLGADLPLGMLMTGLVPPANGRFGPQPLVSESAITDGRWHHIGFVWDGSYRSLYVDGTEVAKDTAAQNPLKSADGGLYIGVDKTLDPAAFFWGLIDDVRIYNIAISAEQIEELAF